MNNFFTKILTISIACIVSVLVIIETVRWRLSDRNLTELNCMTLSVSTNYITVTNYVTLTNFISFESDQILDKVLISTNKVFVLDRGIPLTVNTQTVTSVEIPTPTKTSRLRHISEELSGILEEFKNREK